jgi:hypothetical protein
MNSNVRKVLQITATAILLLVADIATGDAIVMSLRDVNRILGQNYSQNSYTFTQRIRDCRYSRMNNYEIRVRMA